MPVLTNIAEYASTEHFSPASAAQLALCRAARHDLSLLLTLASRSDLCDEAWYALWNTATTQRVRIALAARPLSEPHVSAALTDRRPTVLAALLRHNPRPEVVERIPSKLITGKLADEVVRCVAASDALRRQAATHSSLGAQLRFATSEKGTSISDDEVVDWFAASDPRVPTDTRILTQIVVAARPWIVPRLAGMRDWLTQVIAGSIALRPDDVPAVLDASLSNRYALFALVSNPTVNPSGILETLPASEFRSDVARLVELRTDRHAVTYPLADPDETTLAWLLRRAAVSEARPYGRPLEAAALLHTAAATTHRDTLVEVFRSAFRWPAWEALAAAGLATLGEPIVPAAIDLPQATPPAGPPPSKSALGRNPQLVHGAELMDLAYRELGDDLAMWENFTALVESFDGTLEQLLHAAKALA